MDQKLLDAWEVAARSYLDSIDSGYKLFDTQPRFHDAIYVGAYVTVALLGLHPEGPPTSGLDHMARRVKATSQAAIIEHRGQADVDDLLADGWTWVEGEERGFGKRLRWLKPPDELLSD